MGSARSFHIAPSTTHEGKSRSINSRFPFEHTRLSLSLLSSRSTTMDGRRGGTGELAVYSIIVIYFSNTNSSAASPLRIPESHTRVRERERGREFVNPSRLLAFCFPSTRSIRVYTRPNETDKVR